MIIFLKQRSGKSVVLDVEADATVAELTRLAYEKRGGPATFENYLRSISLVRGFHTLQMSRKLSDYGIVPESTINEVAKAFTMSPAFNWDTLSIEDAVTLEEATEPYMLNPGCGHTLDKTTLQQIFEKNTDAVARCPLCRDPIHHFHFVNFF